MRVFCNVAASVDGRIGPPERAHVSFGSDEDHRRMAVLRRQADAIVTGGATFRAWPQAMVENGARLTGSPPRAAPPFNVVVTAGGGLPLGAPMFADPRVRPLVIQPESAAQPDLPGRVELVRLNPVTARGILDALAARGVEHVLLESGGGLTGMFFRERLVDELHLTLAPLVLAGQGAPTPVDGPAFRPAEAPRLSLVNCSVVGDEVFLHYHVARE
ncbi:MAG: RibD family protein [Deltaproteobacteria bacterium]|nr:RibD family protein [Deltaproteobacteria bacterium]